MLVRTVALTFLCLGCLGRQERVLALEGDPLEGAVLWDAHCQSCHAPDGTGTDAGPDLTDRHETPEQLTNKILYGWGAMEGFSRELSVQETADLVAFVHDELVPDE